ncbi:LysR family transcriptional regulator [Sphingomonas sp. NFR15]|uniref:LysR family transcriptional regulator n=1 Tax=Sphingomonas sp. NFR15 TaxID=1566282 RepID=UPI000888BDDF|nr:LysR family transcriptional regulator [Sphingomonas sp. NFR15]SDA35860.1 DNA-binding transcriptional regulator, LysR family [Sphingomonas sp. NFR15]
MDLPALVDFNLVATHGGFGRASRASGRPKATLSRKVAELEASLGVRLIERGSNTLRLTEEGRALHERTLGPLGEIIEAEQAVASGGSVPSGKLRVSAPIVLAHVLLPKLATRFIATYPQVDLEIVAEDRKVDPVEDNYDCVIRIDPSPEERLVGRRILHDERVLIARPDLPVSLVAEQDAVGALVPAVGRAGVPKDNVWRIKTKAGTRILRPDLRLRFSSFLMVRDAVIAGAGVALVPKLMVADDITGGRLVSWGTHDGPIVEIWALQNSRRLSSSKVRAFLQALAAIDQNRSADRARRLSGSDEN